MKVSFLAAVVTAGMLVAGAAQAADAIVTADLNVRTGPGTGYGVIGSIPNRSPIDVHSCTAGYGWCQVSYGGLSGWASSRYLAMREGVSGGSSDDFGRTAALIGIPLIAGAAIGAAISDRDDYYRGRRWHRHRGDYRRWDRGGRHHRHWNRPRRGPR
ncbi:SH3 domain-containing protein [Falsochrobactrum ovis]|uniref:Uncharacterized protein YraI n=1 Tax=Falsochrobactrum ovis TaxID=1293442 RepID=A0A364JVG2_9HYPH|nr:SH3 domain-containing protein [Falsochrobactrum ovis]RAK29048.1 uncharacterized protein YraI [Falsochrobactrum ovis]